MFNCIGNNSFRTTDPGSCTATNNFHWTSVQVVSQQSDATSSPLPSANNTVSGLTDNCPPANNAAMTVGLGVGLGVGLPLLALAVLLGLLYRSERAKRMRIEREMHGMGPMRGAVDKLAAPEKSGGWRGPLHEVDNTQVGHMPREMEGVSSVRSYKQ